MSKHTAGPWSVELDNFLSTIPGHTVKACNTNKTPVGIVFAHRGTSGPGEGHANAHLITSAPDMLEALEFVLKYDGKKIGSVTDGVVKMAIAKAKGKQ